MKSHGLKWSIIIHKLHLKYVLLKVLPAWLTHFIQQNQLCLCEEALQMFYTICAFFSNTFVCCPSPTPWLYGYMSSICLPSFLMKEIEKWLSEIWRIFTFSLFSIGVAQMSTWTFGGQEMLGPLGVEVTSHLWVARQCWELGSFVKAGCTLLKHWATSSDHTVWIVLSWWLPHFTLFLSKACVTWDLALHIYPIDFLLLGRPIEIST